MYCRNQQYQPWAIPRREAVLDAELPLLQEAQAADPIAAILDRLMTVVSKLETRLDDTDRFVGEFRPPVQPQPDPDPLYNQPPYYGAVMRPLDNHQPDYQQPHYPTGPDPYAQPHYQPQHHPCQLPSLYHPPADREPSYAHHFDWQTSEPPTLQPEMPERRWQPYQPLTHASVMSQWYPPSPTNPPQQVQTRHPTSWDPPGYCQQSGFMPYNQPPPRYHHHDENQLSYGYGSAPAYQQEPYRPTVDQPPAHRVSFWEPSLTATAAANQPHQHYRHPRSDCPLQRSSPAPPVTAPLLASPSHPQAVVPCLTTNEWETNRHEGEGEERMEIQGVVDKHKEAVETIKQDMEEEMEEEIDGRRQLLEDGLRLNIEEVVMKGGASLFAFVGDKDACAIPRCLKEFPFSYSDWHASDVVSMNHRSTSLDADTRLIPPRNDTLYSGICGREDKIHVLALNYHNSKDLPLVSFDVVEEGRRSTSWCMFDPGGDSSLKLLFATLFVVSWFPP